MSKNESARLVLPPKDFKGRLVKSALECDICRLLPSRSIVHSSRFPRSVRVGYHKAVGSGVRKTGTSLGSKADSNCASRIMTFQPQLIRGGTFIWQRHAFTTDGRKPCSKSEIKTNALSSNIFPKVSCSGVKSVPPKRSAQVPTPGSCEM